MAQRLIDRVRVRPRVSFASPPRRGRLLGRSVCASARGHLLNPPPRRPPLPQPFEYVSTPYDAVLAAERERRDESKRKMAEARATCAHPSHPSPRRLPQQPGLPSRHIHFASASLTAHDVPPPAPGCPPQISNYEFVAPSTVPQRPKYKSAFVGDLGGFSSINVNDPYDAALDDALREKWLLESLQIHPRPQVPSGRVEIAGGTSAKIIVGESSNVPASFLSLRLGGGALRRLL